MATEEKSAQAALRDNTKTPYAIYLSQYIFGLTGAYGSERAQGGVQPSLSERSEEQLAAAALGLYHASASKEPLLKQYFESQLAKMK